MYIVLETIAKIKKIDEKYHDEIYTNSLGKLMYSNHDKPHDQREVFTSFEKAKEHLINYLVTEKSSIRNEVEVLKKNHHFVELQLEKATELTEEESA